MVTRVWKIIVMGLNENIHNCYCITDVSVGSIVTLVTERLLLDDLDQCCALDGFPRPIHA